MDVFDEIADAVVAIRSHADLKSAFLKILSIGAYTQQVRVDTILKAILPLDPPEKVVRFISLLKDDKIANLVYTELSK